MLLGASRLGMRSAPLALRPWRYFDSFIKQNFHRFCLLKSSKLCVQVKELEIYFDFIFCKNMKISKFPILLLVHITCLKHLLGAENWWQAALSQSENDIGSACT